MYLVYPYPLLEDGKRKESLFLMRVLKEGKGEDTSSFEEDLAKDVL